MQAQPPPAPQGTTVRRVVADARVDVLLEAFASGAVEPGSGAFAALSAATGAALVATVARRTLRSAAPGSTPRMQEIADEADAARPVLLSLADRDAEANHAVMDAYRALRAEPDPAPPDAPGTDSDHDARMSRLHVVQEALENAVDVQLDLARRAVFLTGLAEEATLGGDPNAAAEGVSAAAALHAAAVAALATVELNAFAIVDDERRAELTDTCSSLRARAAQMLDGAREAFTRHVSVAAG